MAFFLAEAFWLFGEEERLLAPRVDFLLLRHVAVGIDADDGPELLFGSLTEGKGLQAKRMRV
jgi:hypothetical protein